MGWILCSFTVSCWSFYARELLQQWNLLVVGFFDIVSTPLFLTNRRRCPCIDYILIVGSKRAVVCLSCTLRCIVRCVSVGHVGDRVWYIRHSQLIFGDRRGNFLGQLLRHLLRGCRAVIAQHYLKCGRRWIHSPSFGGFRRVIVAGLQSVVIRFQHIDSPIGCNHPQATRTENCAATFTFTQHRINFIRHGHILCQQKRLSNVTSFWGGIRYRFEWLRLESAGVKSFGGVRLLSCADSVGSGGCLPGRAVLRLA